MSDEALSTLLQSELLDVQVLAFELLLGKCEVTTRKTGSPRQISTAGCPEAGALATYFTAKQWLVQVGLCLYEFGPGLIEPYPDGVK